MFRYGSVSSYSIAYDITAGFSRQSLLERCISRFAVSLQLSSASEISLKIFFLVTLRNIEDTLAS